MTENGKEVHLEGRFGWFLSVIRPNGILGYMDTAVRAGSCVGSAVGMGTAVGAGSCAGNAAGMGADATEKVLKRHCLN